MRRETYSPYSKELPHKKELIPCLVFLLPSGLRWMGHFTLYLLLRGGARLVTPRWNTHTHKHVFDWNLGPPSMELPAAAKGQGAIPPGAKTGVGRWLHKVAIVILPL